MATLDSLEQQVNDFQKNTDMWMGKIDKHLEKLNGQTAKNTAFRNKAMGGFTVIGAIGVCSIIGVVVLWIKLLAQ